MHLAYQSRDTTIQYLRAENRRVLQASCTRARDSATCLPVLAPDRRPRVKLLAEVIPRDMTSRADQPATTGGQSVSRPLEKLEALSANAVAHGTDLTMVDSENSEKWRKLRVHGGALDRHFRKCGLELV